MAELPWLDNYSGQTVDELIALEGEYRIDSLVLAFEEALDQKLTRDGRENMSDEEFVVLVIEAMEREVNNGGWGQFFVNTGHFTSVIVDALQQMGCPKVAKIAERAVMIVERAPITEEEIENHTWKEDEDRLDALEECNALYFENPENIERSLFEFIKANRAKINL